MLLVGSPALAQEVKLKADLKGSTKPLKGLDFEERVVSKEEATHNKEAESVCPVNCITIKELKR